MSNSLQPHGLQHIKLPCPSLYPGVCSDSCPFNEQCRPTISSSVIPFSSCLLSFPESGSFPRVSSPNQMQSIGVSASASVFSVNIQGRFPLGLTGLISLLSKGLSRVEHHSLKALILWCLGFFMVHLSHPYVTTGKTIGLTILTFVNKVMSLLFNAV